jgi:hypothetical protein
MKSNHKNLIENVPADLGQLDYPANKILDLTDSLGYMLIALVLMTNLKKIWQSSKKLRTEGKCSSKELLQIVSAILAIVKVIQSIDDEGKDKNE